MKPTIGTDPEFFLFHKLRKVFYPACSMLGGSKNNPRKLSELGHAVLEDNVMVEFNIPPASTEDEFVEHIKFTLQKIREIVPEYLDFKITPSALFGEDALKHPKAKEFGCDPDYSVYTRMQNNYELNESQWRFGGGHIHVGYPNPNPEINYKIVKLMDFTLGLPSIILDDDTNRRQYYGRPGTYRDKSFGVEYRSLSNFWLRDEKLQRWVFNGAQKAFELYENDFDLTPIEKDVFETIAQSDKKRAETLIQKYSISC